MDEKSSPIIRTWTHQSLPPSWVTQDPLVRRALTLPEARVLGGGKAWVPLKWVCYWVQACSSSLHNRPVNLKDEMLSQGIPPYSESQLTEKILPGGLDTSFFYGSEMRRGEGTVKRPLILQIPPRMASHGRGLGGVHFFLPAIYRRKLFWTKAL